MGEDSTDVHETERSGILHDQLLRDVVGIEDVSADEPMFRLYKMFSLTIDVEGLPYKERPPIREGSPRLSLWFGPPSCPTLPIPGKEQERLHRPVRGTYSGEISAGTLPWALRRISLMFLRDGRMIRRPDPYLPATGYCESAVTIAIDVDLLMVECAFKSGENADNWFHLNPETGSGKTAVTILAERRVVGTN